jgi:AraC-like DNA-binding protein
LPSPFSVSFSAYGRDRGALRQARSYASLSQPRRSSSISAADCQHRDKTSPVGYFVVVIPVQGPAERGWRVVEERHDSPLGRWSIVLAVPEGPLQEQVEAVWASAGAGVFTEEEILPRSRTEVLFSLGERHCLRDREDGAGDQWFDRSFVSGLQQGPLRVESPPDSAMAGVRLRPAGVAAFLRDSPAHVAGLVVELEAILGPGVERLRDQILGSGDLRRRVLLLAAAVARHMEGAPGLSPAVRFTLAALHASQGNVPIWELVRATGFSHRWVTERFRSEVGMSPKAYGRLVRFETAFERLASLRAVRWAELALDSGYYDQAHLIREFRQLAGASPVEVFRRRAPDGLGLLADEDAAVWQASHRTRHVQSDPSCR